MISNNNKICPRQMIEFYDRKYVFLIIKKRYRFFQTSLRFFALHYTISCAIAIYGASSYYSNLQIRGAKMPILFIRFFQQSVDIQGDSVLSTDISYSIRESMIKFITFCVFVEMRNEDHFLSQMYTKKYKIEYRPINHIRASAICIVFVFVVGSIDINIY